MSVLTMWLWTSNGHRPLRAPGRPGTTVANPRRRTPLPKDPSDPDVPATKPPSKPPDHWAMYTSVGSGFCFGAVQLSSSTTNRSLVCRGQWSFIATQLSIVYTAVKPRTALCVQLQEESRARNKLYAVWKRVERLDLSSGFDSSRLMNFEHSLPPILD